ncbi:hypothetical protein [Candidatus Methylacidithermus pantelleriae]|uniref:Uncharacterized protein n=1 Tax=Candidatus Methylacidithermus pantelleriae TaxID=2744239 RepID=A0A8J2BHV5_9BACT|nr:hypothetical protein [Candidatus Methylacidithermus pantelleriae]CAF0691435.1 hypothetical protein MPNT_100045 [Candidatus Methylacidithermus pantelleriae]
MAEIYKTVFYSVLSDRSLHQAQSLPELPSKPTSQAFLSFQGQKEISLSRSRGYFSFASYEVLFILENFHKQTGYPLPPSDRKEDEPRIHDL